MIKYSTETILDITLKGGFESNIINHIYGVGGSGKTNIALLLMKSIVKNYGKVIFISTEQISPKRYGEIMGPLHETHGRDILVSEPRTPDALTGSIDNALRLAKDNDSIKGVIVDGITTIYRFMNTGDNELRHENISILAKQMLNLREISHVRDTFVLITSQVYYDPVKKDNLPLGGTLLSKVSKGIYSVEKRCEGVRQFRRFTVVKHKSLETGSYIDFIITDSGIDNA